MLFDYLKKLYLVSFGVLTCNALLITFFDTVLVTYWKLGKKMFDQKYGFIAMNSFSSLRSVTLDGVKKFPVK